MENRRHRVSFDPHYFEKRKESGEELDIEATFRLIYRKNFWGGNESVSGPGSGGGQTEALKVRLPRLLEELNVERLLDLPCGDLSWMKELDFPVNFYIGADIVPELIEKNRERFGEENRDFRVLDLTSDPLPGADLILCRDCLVHLSFADIARAVRNLKNSSITWMLTTTFPGCTRNEDIDTGDWRVLNLELPPFHFPEPRRLINEECTEGDGRFRDKSLGLWRIRDLPEPG